MVVITSSGAAESGTTSLPCPLTEKCPPRTFSVGDHAPRSDTHSGDLSGIPPSELSGKVHYSPLPFISEDGMRKSATSGFSPTDIASSEHVFVNDKVKFRKGPELPSINEFTHNGLFVDKSLPTLSYNEIWKSNSTVHNINSCNEDVVALVSCNCSSVPIYNQCRNVTCANCWRQKCLQKRKKWRKSLILDKGRSYRFVTLTLPRRYFAWEVGQAVDIIHTGFRNLSKSKWWRNRFRLWFGTIEIEAGWSEYQNTEFGDFILPTFNVHLHLVTSGKMPDAKQLLSKWQNQGGGRIDISLLAQKARKRWLKTEACLNYLTKYVTGDKGQAPPSKVFMSDINPFYQAMVSEQVRGRHMFITGGAMRSNLSKKAKQMEDTVCYCTNCNSIVSYLTMETLETHNIEELPRPKSGFWKSLTFTEINSNFI